MIQIKINVLNGKDVMASGSHKCIEDLSNIFMCMNNHRKNSQQTKVF